MDLKYIMFIIFTIGRTGSSLLVNILNMFDDVTFSGEIYSIQLLDKINREKEIKLNDFKVFKKENRNRGLSSSSALYFPRNTNYCKYYNKQNRFMEEFKKMKTKLDKLKYIMPLDKKVGCKILARSEIVREFLGYEISKHFKIILLIRENTNNLRNSMKRASFKSYKYVDLEGENKNYKEINEDNRNIYLLSYEDILNRSKRFKDLFDFVGVNYDEKRVTKGCNEICSYASSIQHKIKN